MSEPDRPAFPDPRPRPDLPTAVTIYEVGPRDGLQAEKAVVPAETKIAFVGRLADAGLHTIETTSFVSPKWVPQLADAAEVLAGIDPGRGPRPVLVPNDRGLDRALESGVRDIAVFVSATESFAKANWNSTVEGALAMAAPVVTRALEAGLSVRGYVSMCWGDPWEGPVDPARPAAIARRLLDLGVRRVSLGDTIGVGTAGGVRAVLDACAAAGVGVDQVALHFHDTYGQALTNVLAGLEQGVTEFDASAGGLGGCPYAKSATGNLATEDLVWLLEGLGIPTGVDLDRLVATSVWMAEQLGRPSPSRVVRALGVR
ncbi:hydroxymethylglutaryl-CoA lyase [Mariniluteicoccus flavus]